MITRKAKNTAIALVAALLIVALAVVCTVTGIKNDPLSQYLQTLEWPQKLPYAYSEESRRLQDQILDCFEQYRAAYPEANAFVSGLGVTTDNYTEYYLGVDCYGSDMAEFEKRVAFPAYVRLNYDPNALDPTVAHPIPREPESQNSYDNGLTIAMEPAVYPLYPETIRCTWSAANRTITYGEGYLLYKYVDGEWVWVPHNTSTTAIANILSAGESHTLSFRPPRLGEGLYRLTMGTYSVEFVVSAV